MNFKQLSRIEIYRGKIFDVYQDQVELPNGRSTQLDVVEHEPAVTILPVDADGQVWLIQQYRYPVNEMLLELPAGVMENGESAEICAARELREEIGMAAEELTALGGFYLAPGYSSEYLYVFLARGLTPDSLPQDEDEFIQVEKVGVEEMREMIRLGKIRDAKTIAAVYLAGEHLV